MSYTEGEFESNAIIHLESIGFCKTTEGNEYKKKYEKFDFYANIGNEQITIWKDNWNREIPKKITLHFNSDIVSLGAGLKCIQTVIDNFDQINKKTNNKEMVVFDQPKPVVIDRFSYGEFGNEFHINPDDGLIVPRLRGGFC